MKKTSFTHSLLSWIGYIAAATAIAFFLNIFIFQITTVSGDSMLQTLKDGDVYVTSKIDHTFNAYPEYGEIVVIDSRVYEKRTFITELTDVCTHNMISVLITGYRPKDYWVKRVIGLPGDVIKTEKSVVYLNGEVLDEAYVNPDEEPYYRSETFTVPQGHVFVMGDNRNNSNDSRRIGPIPIENVIGSVKFKVKSGI